MKRLKAAGGSLVFLLVAPGVVAGVVPWGLTDWRTETEYWLPLRLAGLIVLGSGIVVLVQAFLRFAIEGLGTPAPVAPTERLVVGGLYRHVRNPMYLAVATTIVGQAVWLGRPLLLVYAALFGVVVVVFVRAYEEPTLRRTYGDEYERYCDQVPAWWPRLKPWSDPQRDSFVIDR
jgi:protein-S-isoprenylcysteine O-methyltransferase Ste14